MKYNVICLLLFCFAQSMAQPGTLDPSFGTNGKSVLNLPQGNIAAYAVAFQPDGKIVVAGETFTVDFSSKNFALARFNTDGALDVTFGNSGIVVTDIQPNGDFARAVVVQADGKIVVAGTAHNGANYDFAVARYLPSGNLDTGFGTNGIVLKNFGSTDFGLAVALLPNGKITVAGRAYNGITGDFAMLQLNSDGSADNTFGNNGAVMSDLFENTESANAIAVQPDGKLVLAGDRSVNNGSEIAVARFMPNGSLDAAFGNNGKTNIVIGTLSDVAYAVTIQPNGSIVVAGQSNTASGSDFALARLLPNGTLDNSFDGDGKLSTNVSSGGNYINTMLLQPDGKILAGGSSFGTGIDFSIARYLPDGNLDATFGLNGIALTDFDGGNDVCFAMAIRQQTIMMVGYSSKNNVTGIAAARLFTGGFVPTRESAETDLKAWSVFPNPGRDFVTILLKSNIQDDLFYQFYDLNGRLLLSRQSDKTQTNSDQSLEIQVPKDLPQGNYIIRLISAGKSCQVHWAKQ